MIIYTVANLHRESGPGGRVVGDIKQEMQN